MKLQVVVLFLLVSSCSVAQIELSPASSQSSSDTAPSTDTIWLTGKVVVDGGSAPPPNLAVVLRCGTEEKGRVSSNGKGDFTIMTSLSGELPDRPSARDVFSEARLQACELYADSPDYLSSTLQLMGRTQGKIVQVGTLVVRPRTASEGHMVSVTTLAAPKNAKSDLMKGQQQAKKGKLAAACDYFRKAIQAYPRYALAWLELGRAQVKQNEFSQAEHSFQQAATQDSRFLAAYGELANLALQQQDWKDLAAATERLLQISPNHSANAWFLNSAAYFNLSDMQRAESSAVRGLRIDSNHQVPQLEYLYGLILARRGAYSSAMEHIQAYLRLSPNGSEVDAAAKHLDELQNLVEASASTP